LTKPVFVEEIKCSGGEYHNLECHAIRMDRTLRHFFGKRFVHEHLREFLPEPPDRSTLKCTLIYSDAVLSAELAPWAPPAVKTMGVVAVEGLDFIYKLEDRSELAKIREFAGADEVVIIRNGFVTNCSTGNLVFRDREGVLHTPLHYIHAGTKRALLVKSKKVTTHPIKASSIHSYDRVMIINAMTDVEDDVGVSTDCLAALVHYNPR
jgi:4-amino-4-deoxychorismate lyase